MVCEWRSALWAPPPEEVAVITSLTRMTVWARLTGQPLRALRYPESEGGAQPETVTVRTRQIVFEIREAHHRAVLTWIVAFPGAVARNTPT